MAITKELLIKAAKLCLEHNNCGTSIVQRKLLLDFSKSMVIVDHLEKSGFCGEFNGIKPREIKVKTLEEYQNLLVDYKI